MGRGIRTIGSALVVVASFLVSVQPAEAEPMSWRQFDAGYRHTCGITTGGQLFCWGEDSVGELGDGVALENQSSPSPVEANVTDWVQVSAGDRLTCAIRSSGRLYCWGGDGYGSLGDGDGPGSYSPVPVEVAGARTDWVAVSAGGGHACALRGDRRLACWGYDEWGAVGDGLPLAHRSSPVLLSGRWSSVTAGQITTCARGAESRAGRLYCWGNDDGGQLGNGPPTGTRPAPSEVAGNRTDWAAKATGSAGSGHTCARRVNRQLFCWGGDSRGQLGNGPGQTDRVAPRPVLTLAVDWTIVAAGLQSTCGRRANGRVLCWGADEEGQLGDGGLREDRSSPVLVAGGITDWASVTVGLQHACARRASGSLLCWGRDDEGQLGNGAPNEDSLIPTAVT